MTDTTAHVTNCKLVCDHCAAVVRKANRYQDSEVGYYLLCGDCSGKLLLSFDVPRGKDRQVNAFPGCVSAWEMMDVHGRVPFHVNPLAYMQPTNYHALNTFPLVESGADAWYEIYALNGKVAS